MASSKKVMEAILSLDPTAAFLMSGNINSHHDYETKVVWYAGRDENGFLIPGTPPNPIPTWDEVIAEIERLAALWIALEYQRNRRASYPPVIELLEMIYLDIDNDHVGKNSHFYQTLKTAYKEHPAP